MTRYIGAVTGRLSSLGTRPGKQMNLQEILFSKAGSEIIASITTKITTVKTKEEKIKEKIAPVMKEWDATLEEAMESASNNLAYENLSNKFSNNGPRTVTATGGKMNAVKAMDVALNQIRDAGRALNDLKEEVNGLERVKRNTVATTTYTLDYNDLEELGF